MELFISLLGIIFLMGLAYLVSEQRQSISSRVVLSALALQIGFGVFVLYVPLGQAMLSSTSDVVMSTISYGQKGLSFLFGDLAEFKFGFIFAINVLAMVIFVSALIAVLYHLKVMNMLVTYLGGFVSKIIGTSRTESLSATANIFVGPVEAPIMIRPFVASMTRSEMFAVMTGGLASVAGGTMIGYIQLGVDVKYLLTAAFMTAPAGIVFAKIIFPEVDTPQRNTSKVIKENQTEAAGIFDAASVGAYQGLQQAVMIGASLLAFVGLIALFNGVLSSVGAWFGIEGLTLELILSYLFSPLAWFMGVPSHEVFQAASFIGQKLAVNEFVAYSSFVEVSEQLSPKTQAIISIALCGFANFSSLAFVIGGLSAMVPERRQEIGALGVKALFAAFLANLMSGTIVGLLISLDTLLN